MHLRLHGTPADCARLAFLLRFGPPELQAHTLSRPYPDRRDPHQVRVYLQVDLTREPDPPGRTCSSLVDPDGRPMLVDAWGNPVQEA